MRILSWNVNSVRLRQRSLLRLVRRYEPDVICLQETKVVDDLFPTAPFTRLGYRDFALSGQKGYHGVAILSRLPLATAGSKQWCRRADRRHVYATLPGGRDGIELHNVYAPSGGDVPDPSVNPKFDHKLRFFSEMTRWFRRQRGEASERILVGDLNVAPLETDVWSHQKLRRVVTHTPVEIAALGRLAASLDWVDAVRHFVPDDTKLYTWWSYRAADWRLANKGRRLDHAWVTPGLAGRLRAAKVLARVRGWKTPSDHAPLLLELS